MQTRSRDAIASAFSSKGWYGRHFKSHVPWPRDISIHTLVFFHRTLSIPTGVWDPFLESPGNSRFGPVKPLQNLTVTELFYSHILNVNRGSLHTKSFRRIHFSGVKNRWIKNRFAGPKSFWDFRETGARWLGDLPEGDVWIPLGGCLWFDEFDFASPAANLHKKKLLVSTAQKGLATTTLKKIVKQFCAWSH